MRLIFINIFLLLFMSAQAQINGAVQTAESKEPLIGATAALVKGGNATMTDDQGRFSLPMGSKGDTLIVRYIGYLEYKLAVNIDQIEPIVINLSVDPNSMEEVVINTGFFQVPKERATGSFSHVDNKLLNRMVGGNILQRLDGIASGVQFTKADGMDASAIRVRGLATIVSDEMPLIVVDNFPYEGNIENINPEDVESITVLKDAAAASIWGARAGNGVIVITTKQGRYNQKTQISVNNNFIIGEKPDLFYSRNRLPSNIVMQIEKEKYETGGYYNSAANETPFPEYVELLIKRDKNIISESEFIAQESAMKNTEVRDEALKHLYQPSIYRQHSLSVKGGEERYRFYLSGSYDKNRSTVIGNTNDRLSLGVQNAFRPIKGMELTTGIKYNLARSENNGISLNTLDGGLFVGVSPYIRLVDDEGNPLPIVKDYRSSYKEQAEQKRLLDWQFSPLIERELVDNHSKRNEIRLEGGLRYSFLQHFNVNASYQFVKEDNHGHTLYKKDSYYVRNMVNRFTQADGSNVIPHNAIFDQSGIGSSVSQSGRAQVNYNQFFGTDHLVNVLAGVDVREYIQDTNPGTTIYDYDVDILIGTASYNYMDIYNVNPTGRSRIPAPSSTKRKLIDRYLSYFGNASYIYKNRYVASTSFRWDGSNLFGVRANQKGTPLWSIGGSWDLSKESFYNRTWLPYLRIRSTFGSSGNVNKRVSAFPTILHSSQDGVTGLPNAMILSVGNPSLRWEQVSTLNLAMDWGIKLNRINGSFEYYTKWAKDLLGADYLAPSTGIITGGTATNANLINYANLKTKGVDVQVNSRNLNGTFQWNTSLLWSWSENKITHFNTAEVNSIGVYSTSPAPSIKGVSRDVVYSLPWNGLNGQNGMPIVLIDGVQTENYRDYYQSFVPQDLLISGKSIPTAYGSLRNDFHYKGFSIGALISWKFDYVFRRRSMAPGAEYDGPLNYHLDYLKRWEKPGDEKYTDVPAWSSDFDTYKIQSYVFSEALITKGDHIRLQDINLSYVFNLNKFGSASSQRVRLYANARNLGIIWRSNKLGIDPDYPVAEHTSPKTFALGLQVEF